MTDPAAPAAGGRFGARMSRSLHRLAGAVAALAGWRRVAVATGLGAATTLAMPPWYLVPLLLFGFVGLAWLLDGAAAGPRPVRRATLAGFWFGLAYFIIGLHWLAEAFLVDPVRHGWMIPFALGGLSALLALFPAAACGFAVWAWKRFGVTGAGRVLLFAVCWSVGEWLRGWVLTGFPWNLVGYTWTFAPETAQLASVVGINGLSLLTVAVAAMPAVLGDGRLSRQSAGALVAAVLVLVALAGFGWLRLAAAPAVDLDAPAGAFVEGVRLRLVQAGIPQRLKWRSELREANLRRHVELSKAAADTPPTHIVWPETAVPFFLVNDARARNIVATAVPPGGLLLTGTVRYDDTADGRRRLYNSAIALSADGAIVARYDKSHLVPFGEYVPLGDILPLDKIVVGVGNFVAGPGLRTLDLPGLPAVGPLICYEAIFSGAVTARDRRPDWLLNLTNDGWFGTNAGPRQHLAIASMRAVEEGLPLVRAAGTGISAVFDPYGRRLGMLGIGEVGVLDLPLPRVLPPTLFARFGNSVPAILMIIFLILGYRLRRA